MRKHIVIPDTQVTPDTPTDHLSWIGEFIADERPDVIVQIGDFADMEALSGWSKRKELEGRRINNDFEATVEAMSLLVDPIDAAKKEKPAKGRKKWKPEMHLTLGNHEHRITRAIDDDPRMDGVLSLDMLGYEDEGWAVHPFLTPVEIDGVHYAHYFINPTTGRPYGGQSIDTRLKNIGFSFTMGHQQTLMSGQRFLNNGQRIRGLVAGSAYLHDEDYRGAQANGEWRGILVKNEVVDGSYDLVEVSLDYLCRRFEGPPLHKFMAKKYPGIFEKSTWLQRAAAVRGA